MFVARLAEKGAEFVLADIQVIQGQEGQGIFGFEIEGNFEFHEDDIVVQLLFRRGLWPVPFSAFFHDQTIEKSGKLQITELLIGRVIVFFQPVADLRPCHLETRQGKRRDHLRIVKIENVSDSAQDIVLGHG